MSKPLSALVSMNAFKGHLSNTEACAIVCEALEKIHVPSRVLPVGDGGLGTLEAVHSGLEGQLATFDISGPLGKKGTARVLCFPSSAAPTSLYIESAEAVGYHLIEESERDPMRASSFGLGELLSQALAKWGDTLTRIYIGLGDSAISDMGMGMLSQLGFGFIDGGGRTVWGNAEGLRSIRAIQVPNQPLLHEIEYIVLCDVLNPLLGPDGSARIFSPQKGATQGQVRLIEQGMENLATLIHQSTGRSLRNTPMAGSAGGLAAAFLAFFNAQLVQGAPFLLDLINYDRALSEHAFVITGEGKTDGQTLSGKAPYECLRRAEQQGKKAVFLSGSLGEGHEALLRQRSLAGLFVCGDLPNSHDALYDKALEVFSDMELRKTLA